MAVSARALFGRFCFAVLPLGLASFLSGPAWSLTGDPISGEELAQKWCAACHVVSEDQNTAPAAQMPTFKQIAEKGIVEKSGIGVFLAAPHPQMPKLSLTRQQMADLQSYIVGLKPKLE